MASILVADDRQQDRELLATILKYAKHEVLEAGNGAEALDLTRRHRPDLVVTDIVMPVMDGFEFVRRLRTDRDLASIPVLFYTATYLEHDARRLAEDVGVHRILGKPSDPELMLEAVQSLLGLEAIVPHPTWELPATGPLDKIRQANPYQAERLHAMNMRLAALLDLGLELAPHEELEQLIQVHCRAGRKILGVQYAGVCLLDPHTEELASFIVDGLEGGAAGSFSPVAGGPLADVARDGRSRRARIPSEVPSAAGLPAGHPPVHSLLVVPVRGVHGAGAFYFANKLGEGGFSEDDELIAATLAAKMSLRCENARLFGEVQSRSVQLENEVRQRTRMEEDVRRLNEDLLQKVRLLSQSNADLDRFAFTVSHDLRAPLRTVDSYAQLLARRFQDAEYTDAREFAAYIREGTERIRALLDGLLAYSRVAQARAEPESTDSNRVLQEALANLRDTVAETQAVISESTLPPVRVNRTQLLQVFQNLLGNALKYSEPGVAPRVEISATRLDSMVQFAVADHGLGIPPAFHEKIFELFQRAHGEAYQGVGVGLAICKRLVERGGGRIWLESQPGVGSTFYFTLPTAEAFQTRSA